MRIIIDTDIQAIIVPDSYYMQVDKLNEVITEAGGNPLDYTAYIKTCFDKAYNTQIVRNSDIAKLKPRKKAKKPASGSNDTAEKKDDKKTEAEKKTTEAPKGE